MKFQKHTSDEMVALFHKRPYQGQSPEEAAIVFLSSDANYSPAISSHSFFEHILEYHEDGIAFWKRYGCHHPFMLPNYPFNRNKAGVPFHRNFSKLGLGPEYAEHICFLELLDVPTIGNKSEDRDQFYKLLSLRHLEYIESLIRGGGHKLFFVSNGVLKNLKKIKKSYPLFDWFDWAAGSERVFMKSINGNEIKEIYHFSSFQIHSQIEEIKSEIDRWLTEAKGSFLCP
jgi:hypothetical protein